MVEHKSKVWAFSVSLLLGLASASLTACGSGQQGDAADGVMGRLTSISDTKVIVEVFDQKGEHPPKAASGGAAEGEMKRRPEGTPPADIQRGEKGNPGDGKESKTRESKTFVIGENTKFYKQEGEEETEITADELELGSMLSIIADGEVAESIHVLQMDGGQRGERGQKKGERKPEES